MAEENNVEEITLPSLTYAVRNGRIIGKIDAHEAMMQAIKKIFKTERFIFPIYNDQYGHDLNELIGKDYDYIKSDVERMIKEAVKGDDRVDDVTIDAIDQIDRNALSVTITVSTMYGEITTQVEVTT